MIRIISDLHYGDRASRLTALEGLGPLFEGIDSMLVNGDAVDTRVGPHPARTRAQRDEVTAFFGRAGGELLTGNHDPDISSLHHRDLAGGRVLVVHGDVLFDEVVPWGRDAAVVRRQVLARRAALPAGRRGTLEAEMGVFREVTRAMEQRHQAETDPWKYFKSFLSDTVWPPWKALRILQAWHQGPERAAAFAERFRPRAQAVVVGHLHKPGVWRTRDGRTVVNTGSFCPPFGGFAVDVTDDALLVHRLVRDAGAYRLGACLARVRLE